MEGFLSSMTWPIIAVVAVIAIFVLIGTISRFYIRVPPNKAAFFYGARSGRKGVKKVLQRDDPTAPPITVLPPGTVVVTGGGRMRKPIIEEVQFLDLSEITLPQLKVEMMPNKDGVLVTVEAVANIRFQDDAVALLAAGARFLGMPREQIIQTARETLEANLRGVIGTLTVEELIQDRDKFRQKVLEEAGQDLRGLGMQIDVFNPQSITDSMGYIEALGKKRTAEVQRDATIGEAEATAEARKRSTDAERDAEVVAQDNERQKAEATKNADVAKRQYEAEVAREAAIAEQAGPLAKAQAEQEVVIAQVKIEEEQARASIAVEEQNILREQKAKEATTVVPAKAEADAAARNATGYKDAAILKADGDKHATIARADAEQHKREAEGQGLAGATQAKGLAEAEVIKQQGLAEAEVIREKGLAKAIALSELADGYTKFNEAALTLELIRGLPPAIEALGSVFGAIAAPLGNIDKLVVVDSGGGDGNSGALNRLARTGPLMLLQLTEQAKAVGIDLTPLFAKLGLKFDGDGVSVPATAPAD